MAYTPPSANDFQFSLDDYEPVSDFRFYTKQKYPFIVPPGIVRYCRSKWQKANDHGQGITQGFGNTLTINKVVQQSSQQGNILESLPLGVFWNQVPSQQKMICFSHSIGQVRSDSKSGHWSQIAGKESDQNSAWNSSIQSKDEQAGDQWNKPPEVDQSLNAGFNRVDEFGSTVRQVRQGYRPPATPLLHFAFAGNQYTPVSTPAVYFAFGESIPTSVIQPRDNDLQARFSSNQHQDEVIRLPWGFGQKAKDEEISSQYGGETEPEVTEKPDPEQPDIRESYLLMNIISTVVLPQRTPIDLPTIDISLDIDSFSWSLNAELWGATSLSLIEPDENGTKQIEIDINGWKWVFIIERYSTDRRFGNERYTIYGSSRSQLLASPYAPLRNKSNSADLNAKQAITEELANTGFTAIYPDINDYETPDWIMPGNTFSYQNETPMKVIAKLAGTAGSVIIPSRDSDELNIQPRYPASPWHWNTATMDKIVPAALVISLSASWRPEPEYNAVYVSGTHAGVAVNVKRTGSNGDLPAPDILEDWLTETQVNTERGRNELAKGGQQSVTTLEIPLTDTSTAPGLIEPGLLIEVQDTFNGKSGNWRGLCLSVGISAGAGIVTQSIGLERHY